MVAADRPGEGRVTATSLSSRVTAMVPVTRPFRRPSGAIPLTARAIRGAVLGLLYDTRAPIGESGAAHARFLEGGVLAGKA